MKNDLFIKNCVALSYRYSHWYWSHHFLRL